MRLRLRNLNLAKSWETGEDTEAKAWTHPPRPISLYSGGSVWVLGYSDDPTRLSGPSDPATP
jgi:hypothetical protein